MLICTSHRKKVIIFSGLKFVLLAQEDEKLYITSIRLLSFCNICILRYIITLIVPAAHLMYVYFLFPVVQYVT